MHSKLVVRSSHSFSIVKQIVVYTVVFFIEGPLVPKLAYDQVNIFDKKNTVKFISLVLVESEHLRSFVLKKIRIVRCN